MFAHESEHVFLSTLQTRGRAKVGTVGGSLETNPSVKINHRLLGSPGASELAGLMSASMEEASTGVVALGVGGEGGKGTEGRRGEGGGKW